MSSNKQNNKLSTTQILTEHKSKTKKKKGKNPNREMSLKHGNLTFAKPGDFVKHVARLVGPWLGERRRLLQIKNEPVVSAGFFSSEKKMDPSMDERLAAVEFQLKATVEAFRSAIGIKPVKFRLTIGTDLTATVTSGIINLVVSLTASATSEWSSISALFDEVRMTGGTYDFVHNCQGVYATGVTDTSFNSSYLALAFDPTDSGALTSVLQATEYSNHKLYPTNQAILSNAAYGTVLTTKRRNVFHWRPEPGVFANSTVSVGAAQWQPTSSVLPCGFLKFYTVGAEVVAKKVAAGVLYFDVELRCRV